MSFKRRAANRNCRGKEEKQKIKSSQRGAAASKRLRAQNERETAQPETLAEITVEKKVLKT